MTDVRIRHPAVSVVLHKNIGRTTVNGRQTVSERFAGARRTIDLTPFLGEAGSVQVSKSVREPAGSFSITFGDRISSVDQDSIYGLVEPMDLVEIRMAGDAYRHRGDGLPIMMRGLVSRVSRAESAGADGRVQRSVAISGQDYGKIWQIIQIFNNAHAAFIDQGTYLLSSLPFYARFGGALNTQEADKFVRSVFDELINPYIDRMAEKGSGGTSPLQRIATSGIVARDGRVSPFGIGGWSGGTIYSLLEQHCDVGSWNELFIDDDESGPKVVYRQNPFIDVVYKTPIMDLDPADMPPFVAVGREDVVGMTVERSDADVANFFWVQSPRFALNYDHTLKLFSYKADPKDVYDKNYGNNDPDLYGVRKMEDATQQAGRDETSNGNGTPYGMSRDISQSSAIGWMNARRRQLREINRDNVLLEHGSARIKGNEALRAGSYMRLKHGSMLSDYYVPEVTHEFMPFVGYFTTATLERGTGFVDRMLRGAGSASPYWSEMAR